MSVNHCLYMSAVIVYLNVMNAYGGLCPLQHSQPTSKCLLHFFFLSVSFCYSVAHYCVHGARHGPGLAYWRARQPERQSACHIPGAPELDASSSSQIQSHWIMHEQILKHSWTLSEFIRFLSFLGLSMLRCINVYYCFFRPYLCSMCMLFQLNTILHKVFL